MRNLFRHTDRPGWTGWWPLLLVALFIGLMVVRGVVVELRFGEYVGCPGCFGVPSVSADGWLLALLCALLLALVNSPWRWLGRLFGVAVSVLLLLYAADVFIINLFGIRLFFVDLALYGLDPSVIWDQFSGLFYAPWMAFGAAAAMVLVALLPALLAVRRHRLTNGVLAGVLAGALVLVALPARPDYVHNWIYSNFLQANLISTESVHYSAAEAERLEAAYQAAWPDRCVEGPAEQPNVIVVLVESWSNFHSPAFGGFENWTPELDRLARRYPRLTRFHAGGFGTIEGLINLLGGARLWAPFVHLFEASEFGYAWGMEPTLPGTFNRAGYHTGFLSTGPLGWLRWGEWMEDLGFDQVEGNEHPFYQDWPKVSFHAAADEALYKRALQWLDEESAEPYMLLVESVSTHQPYIDPDTGVPDKLAAFAYADRWAVWFYQQLSQRGYFDDGILILTGDHRIMDPLRPAEQQRFGLAAASLVPLVWIEPDPGLPRVVDGIYKQADLLPTLAHRIHGRVCMDEFQASLFEDPPHDGNCAFHLRGAERGIVDVFCAEGQGQVRLDGDATDFRWHEGLDEQRRQRILQTIARERLEGLRRHRRAEGQ